MTMKVLDGKANSHICRRACQAKTDGENRHEDEDVLMPKKIEKSDLPNTVTGEEAETWSDESEKPKHLDNSLTIPKT